jgi:hypothetical protein
VREAPARTLGVAVAMSVLAIARVACGQVSCADPNNLCTGDPCVIPTLEVLSPCVIDFRPRSLVIEGLVRVPSAGQLSFTAAAITVQGRVFNRPGTAGGADISLVADGNIDLDGGARVRGGLGSITLDAGGDIHVRGPLRGYGSGAMALTVDAGGTLTVERTIRASLGSAALRGAAGVLLSAPVIVPGGMVEVSSSAGAVTLDADVSVTGQAGGTVTVDAQDDVIVNRRVRAFARYFAAGGGSIALASVAGDVTVNGDLLAQGGASAPGGVIDITAGSSAVLSGFVNLHRGGDLRVVGSAGVVVGSLARVEADGTRGGCGGELRFQATAGDLSLGGSFSARSDADATDTCGILEGTATGNVLASCAYTFAPHGCIAFSAGGTLDTSGGTFDVPILPDCPGS